MKQLSKHGPWIAVLVVLLWSVPAMAASLEEAEDLFAEGDFLAAAEAGRALNTAAGLAVAARATLAQAEFRAGPDRRMAMVRAAEASARAALAMDPDQVEALIQLSLALGYRARHQGALAAHFQGFVEEGKGYLLRALQLQPENPWANAMLGAWHLEVVKQGGPIIASTIYGATTRSGIGLFERALGLDPDNLALHFELALALLSLDPGAYATRATGHLEAAVAAEPGAAFERFVQGRAKSLLAATRNGDRRALDRQIDRIRDIRAVARGGRRSAPRPVQR